MSPRERLLLVAGEGAALILAFAAFAASARRSEVRLLEEQLQTFGATRPQIVVARAAETLVPATAGLVAALAALVAAGALPGGTIAAIVGVTVVAALVLLTAGAERRRPRFGVGALEVAALAALGIVVWQTTATGGLDPARIASENRGSPILLLLPALAAFATAVLILRALPLLLRVAERLARKASFGVRLAFLSAARNPGQAAAATTFLAVTLGASLFSLDYRATLDRQARDESDFAAGAAWRVAERPSVAPLTRYRLVSAERPTPALRLDARLPAAIPGQPEAPLRVLAVPAARLPELRGWREGYSTLTRAEIARRLRPRPVRLTGPRIATDATALRVWVHAETQRPRVVVLHFLLPGQGWAHVRLGVATGDWRRLSLRVVPGLRGAQLVGVEFLPTFIPLNGVLDLSGIVQFGRLEQRTSVGWSALPSLRRWTAADAGGDSGFLVGDAPFAADAPVRRGVEFDLNGTPTPLIRPDILLPAALPALATGPVAAEAVDRQLVLDLDGRELHVRVVGTTQLVPTVVARPSSAVLLDYDTLFAALNLDHPGTAVPNEAWFFGAQRPAFAERLAKPPFRLLRAVGASRVRDRLLHDPLAGGTRDVLGVTALVAAALGLLGLVLATRSALASERLLLAEYEALGVPRPTLGRSTQLRLVVVSLLGLAAGFAGGLLTVRLIGAFVAVTGTAALPLPSIVAVVAWKPAALTLAAVGTAAVVAALVVGRRAVRETAAVRLRA